MKMTAILAFAFMPCLAQQGVTASHRSYLEPNKPLVVLFDTRASIPAYLGKWNRLFLQDALVDFDYSIREVVGDGPAGEELDSFLHSQFSLKEETAWCLIGRKGDLLASGMDVPEASILAQALEAGGEPNPVRELQSFLRNHPTQAEMRLELVKKLGFRVSKRLKATPSDGVNPLGEDKDQALWGSFAKHLELLFLDSDWAALRLDLYEILPNDCPEKHSTTMRALYGRLRPRVQHYLQYLPEDSWAWCTLLRMDQALGEESILPLLQATAPFQTPFQPFSVPTILSRKLLLEARHTGKWNAALPVFRSLWEGFKAGQLNSMGLFSDTSIPQSGLGHSISPEHRKQLQTVRLMEGWNSFLSPLLEALLCVRGDGEAMNLLTSLDERWLIIDMPALASRLASSHGRPDLARNWKNLASFTFPARMPQNLNTTAFSLFIQFQDSIDFIELYGLASRGLMLITRQASPPWQLFLGWADSQPRWALVSPDGSVVLNKGGSLPSADELFQQFQATGTHTPLQSILAFLTRNPDNHSALQALTIQQKGMAGMYLIQTAQQASPAHSSKKDSDPLEPNPLVAYASTLKRLLDTPYSLISLEGISLSGIWPVFNGPGSDLAIKSGLFQELAEKTLPRIEAELSRRPHDRDLWSAWSSLAPMVDRPLKPLLESLEPGAEDPKNPWPPREIQAEYVKILVGEGQWAVVEKILAPQWKPYCKEMAGLFLSRRSEQSGAFNPEAWQNLLLPLAVAYLRQGNPEAADDLIQSWAKLNLRLGDLGSLLSTANELGYTKYADLWRKLAGA